MRWAFERWWWPALWWGWYVAGLAEGLSRGPRVRTPILRLQVSHLRLRGKAVQRLGEARARL